MKKSISLVIIFLSVGVIPVTFGQEKGRVERPTSILNEYSSIPPGRPEPVTTWPYAGQPTTGGSFRITPDAGAQFDSSLAVELLRALDSVRTILGMRGSVGAVYIPGQGVWEGASGMSTVSPPETLKTDMLFSIASNTKTFISALTLTLVEDGLLSLEDTVGHWVTSYPNILGNITIRQLLNMTSGIFDFLNDNPGSPWADSLFDNPTRFWTPEDIVTTFVDGPHFLPGTDWKYSNTNYLLLGMIIHAVTGSTVSTELHNRLFTPLGLNETFYPPEDSLASTVAQPKTTIPYDTGMYTLVGPAGAIFSRAENLVRWAKSLYGGEILAPSSLEEMQTLAPFSKENFFEILNPFVALGYGLGTAKMSYFGKTGWVHNGILPGYLSQVDYLPRFGVSVAVLINQSSNLNSPFYIHDALLRAYLKTLTLPPASHGVLYATTAGPGEQQLLSIDTSTASIDTIGSSGYSMLVSARVRPGTHTLYGLLDIGQFLLVRIDPDSGDPYPVGPLPLTGWKGMAFRGDTLYAARAGLIYKVDVATGAATFVASAGIPISGMDFDPVTGVLWASTGLLAHPDSIYTIDLPSGTRHAVGATGQGIATSDILFDGRGNLLGLTGYDSEENGLIRINPVTGAGTVVGSLGRSDVRGIAMIPETTIVASSGIQFGNVYVDSSRTDSVTVVNPFPTSLTISSVVSDHPGVFTAVPTSGSIAPGESLTVYITFSPKNLGKRYGTFSFTHDHTGSPVTLFVAGAGIGTVSSLSIAVDKRWNMVSVPLEVEDFSKDVLFPGSSSGTYSYHGGYQPEDRLFPGSGYWIKYDSAMTLELFGAVADQETLTVETGWNIVGSITSPLPVSSIGSIPPGITTTAFYDYIGDPDYLVADSIRPGYGYWVKVSQSGKLVLSTPSAATPSNRIRIVDTGELPPSPPEVVSGVIPKAYALDQNYPNPFNPSTEISYSIPTPGLVTLRIFNLLGQEVVTLVSERKEAGFYRVQWNGQDSPSGIYFCRLQTVEFTETKKMVLMK